ncbi:MAG: DMT family transporter [Firmicutes bacterium]|nr:DMT family transporter [Bacillota bacterium]
MKKFKGQICLLLAAIIWGSAFIFQKMGMDHIGPFTFGIFRFTLGSLALLPVIWIYGRLNNRKLPEQRAYITPWKDKELLLGGLLCGLASFIAGSLQQIGIVYTTAGKAGFITSMDIVMVPIILLFMRRKVERWTWLGIAAAFIGLWLLCITEGFTIAKGDAFVIGCAVVYSIQILLIDHYAERVDVLKLSFLQFFLSGILSIPFALITETINMHDIIACAGPILYTAFLEVSIAFTLQIVGQKYTSPAPATIIISLESVFAALSGALFLHETMSGRELTGCIIMFAAFIIAQIPEMRGNSESEDSSETIG